jgi:hypothetical protein
MEEEISKYIIIPVIIVLGIIITGTLIQSALELGGAVVALFGAVGGIAFIASKIKSE